MIKYVYSFLFTLIFIASCALEPVEINSENLFGQLPDVVNHPIDNPPSLDKNLLGRKLFWDPILSGNKDIACVSCHHPKNAYAEKLDLSLGVGGQGLSSNRINGTLIKRNAQSILNTAFNGIDTQGMMNPHQAPMFWDNRTMSLEEQSIQPILSAEEMRGTLIAETDILDTIMQRLNAIPEYVSLFKKVFGNEGINMSNLAKALSSFERSLIANSSRFDKYAGGDESALSSLELRGMINFAEVGCANCHNGPMFSDFELHVLTVPESNKLEKVDKGDGNFAFRTPSLRNLTQTAPYMHNGVFSSLEEVMDFYDDVDDESQNIHVSSDRKDEKLSQLNIPDDKVESIIAFLHALNDEDFDKEILEEVPSKLKAGGEID